MGCHQRDLVSGRTNSRSHPKTRQKSTIRIRAVAHEPAWPYFSKGSSVGLGVLRAKSYADFTVTPIFQNRHPVFYRLQALPQIKTFSPAISELWHPPPNIANREHANHSTGPRTPEAKSRTGRRLAPGPRALFPQNGFGFSNDQNAGSTLAFVLPG